MRKRKPRSVRQRLKVLVAVVACVIGVPIAILLTIGFAEGVKEGLSVPPGKQMHVVLPLRVDDAGLNSFVRQVSTPGGPQYHHYESISWLANHFGAPAKMRQRVISYLNAQGASGVAVDHTGLFVSATLSAAKAERIFGIELHEHHQAGRDYTAPTGAVKLPKALRPYVTSVIGLNTKTVALPNFGGIGTRPTGGTTTGGGPATGQTGTGPTGTGTSTSGAGSGYASGYDQYTGTPRGCPKALNATDAMGFAPNQYLTAYGYAPLQAHGLDGAGITVALVEIDGFKRSDIDVFARCFGLHVPPISAYGVGVGHQLEPGGETTLDLEVLDAAAPDLKRVDIYETHSDVADVLQALAAPLQSEQVPQIVSVSLGQCELATVQNAGKAAVQAAESELEEATASGITVLASTGDSGSADCPGNGSRPAPLLAVNYPASSPWVTAVGGTNLHLDTKNQIDEETVWNDGSAEPGDAGGGGVSSQFPRPSYQDGVVRSAGRALPDVAMLADLGPGYDIYCTAQEDCDGDGWSAFGGTSAATPLLAGGLALVDEALNERGRQTLGFVNPLLYQLGESQTERALVYHDVRTGDNDVGPYTSRHRPLGCCTAARGFDEASGWGSLDLTDFEADALTSESPLVKITIAVPQAQRAEVVKAGGVYANVTCAGPCHTSVLVAVQVGNAKPFYAYSRDYSLTAAGTKRVEIPLAATQLARIRHALAAGTGVGAGVIAATLDAGGNEERLSKAIALPIT